MLLKAVALLAGLLGIKVAALRERYLCTRRGTYNARLSLSMNVLVVRYGGPSGKPG